MENTLSKSSRFATLLDGLSGAHPFISDQWKGGDGGYAHVIKAPGYMFDMHFEGSSPGAGTTGFALHMLGTIKDLAKRFDEILAQDFYCTNPDKSLVDRAAFLKQTAVPVTIRNLIADEVKIRVLGDFAIIHGRTSYITADGQQAYGRYTDCWARQNGHWLAVSAHVAR